MPRAFYEEVVAMESVPSSSSTSISSSMDTTWSTNKELKKLWSLTSTVSPDMQTFIHSLYVMQTLYVYGQQEHTVWYCDAMFLSIKEMMVRAFLSNLYDAPMYRQCMRRLAHCQDLTAEINHKVGQHIEYVETNEHRGMEQVEEIMHRATPTRATTWATPTRASTGASTSDQNLDDTPAFFLTKENAQLFRQLNKRDELLFDILHRLSLVLPRHLKFKNVQYDEDDYDDGIE